MQLFYNSLLTIKNTSFTFNKNESRHIIRVLRKKEGDALFITNGKGYIFKATLLIAHEKKCGVKIISFEKRPKEWNYYLHLAIAPTKMIERYEWFLEKAVEIGIDEITPIICKNSERKFIKIERLQNLIVSAMKQSLKYQLPKLNPVIKYSDFIKNEFHGCKLIAHCENSNRESLKSQLNGQDIITVLIGPEGDFSSKEIGDALEHKFIPLSLGKSRLRTETAGIVVCNSISVLKSDL